MIDESFIEMPGEEQHCIRCCLSRAQRYAQFNSTGVYSRTNAPSWTDPTYERINSTFSIYGTDFRLHDLQRAKIAYLLCFLDEYIRLRSFLFAWSARENNFVLLCMGKFKILIVPACYFLLG